VIEALELDAKTGLRYRPATNDRAEIRATYRHYAHLTVHPGDVCLDLGANVGAATRLLLSKGAEWVWAIEPDPTTFALLEQNVAGLPVTALMVAVAAEPGMAFLNVSKRGNSTRNNTALRATRNYELVAVRAVTLGSLLAMTDPTVLKCDIEYAEHSLPELRALPARVRLLQIEVHLHNGGEEEITGWRRSGGQLIDALTGQGFRLLTSHELRAPFGAFTGGDDRFSPYAMAWNGTFERDGG